jgi:hypothetical protein
METIVPRCRTAMESMYLILLGASTVRCALLLRLHADSPAFNAVPYC